MLTGAQIAEARTRIPLHELIGRDTALRREGGWMVGRCPFHDDSSPSFGVKEDHWKCFAGCGSGDAIDYVMRRRGIKFDEAVRELGNLPAVARQAIPQTTAPRASRDDPDGIETARRIWAESGAIAGTPAEIYLMSRMLPWQNPSLSLRAHASLRCRDLDKNMPALVAALKNSEGKITAIQRIWLEPGAYYTDGAGGDPKGTRAKKVPKKSLGVMADGCVRLSAAATMMGISEGIESALSCQAMFKINTWSTCGAARMATAWIPPECETLLIFADLGDTGIQQAEKAAAAHRRSGLRVDIIYPEEGFSDFNDQLRAQTLGVCGHD